MPRYYGQCIVCVVRKARYANMTCNPCYALVEAEGSHEKYGIVKESPVRERWKQEAAEYNKLMRKGVPQHEIAKAWGITVRKLRADVTRWKRDGGIKVIPGWTQRQPVGTDKQATSKMNKRPLNDHGGGRWGVRNCQCGPCMAVRRATRVDLDARMKEKKNKVKPS